MSTVTPFRCGEGGKALVVYPEMTREEWEEKFGSLTDDDVERQWREMFNGDPLPPGTLDPTFDEGS